MGSVLPYLPSDKSNEVTGETKGGEERITLPIPHHGKSGTRDEEDGEIEMSEKSTEEV